jgi:hypothetical protein
MDGFTFKAVLPAVEGRWSAITFRYRPMSPDEESEIFARLRLEPTAPSIAFYAPVMAQKILGWDLKDHDGNAVPISEDVLRKRIPPQLFDAFKQYVDGTLMGDREKN